MATNQAWVSGIVRQGSTSAVASTILAAMDHDTYVYTYHPATQITPSSCPICETNIKFVWPYREVSTALNPPLQQGHKVMDGIPTYMFMYASNRLTVTIARSVPWFM